MALGHTTRALCNVRHMAAHGISRKRNGWGDRHSVRVKYDDAPELWVPESFYTARGWQPSFDELPWEGENKPKAEAEAEAKTNGSGNSKGHEGA